MPSTVASASLGAYQLNSQFLGQFNVGNFGKFESLAGGTSGSIDGQLSGAVNNANLVSALNSLHARITGSETAASGTSGSIQFANEANEFAYATGFKWDGAGLEIVGDLSASAASKFGADLTVNGDLKSGGGEDVSRSVFAEITTATKTLTLGGGGIVSAAGELKAAKNFGVAGGAVITGSIVGESTVEAQGQLAAKANFGVDGGAVISGSLVAKSTVDAEGQLAAKANFGVDGNATITGSLVVNGARIALGSTNGVVSSSVSLRSPKVVIAGGVTQTNASPLLIGESLGFGSLEMTSGSSVVFGKHGGVAAAQEPANGTPAIQISGSVKSPSGDVSFGSSVKAFVINQIPHMSIMGVDESGMLKRYRLQVSGGLLQLNNF